MFLLSTTDAFPARWSPQRHALAAPRHVVSTMTTQTAEPSLIHRCAAVIRRIIGAPDYDTYLAHMTSHHPEQTPLSKRDFENERLVDRYSRPGSRCC
jgi:uncharacterized short protein YbdD (DUF466 family)